MSEDTKITLVIVTCATLALSAGSACSISAHRATEKNCKEIMGGGNDAAKALAAAKGGTCDPAGK